MPIITLIQRNDPNQAPQSMPPVPVAGDLLRTGVMGDCVCVIVLFNQTPAGTYTGMRGYHGGGGLGSINFPALFNGVPPHYTTKIIMISGPLNMSQYATQTNFELVKQEAAAHNLPHVQRSFWHGGACGQVDRLGNVTAY